MNWQNSMWFDKEGLLLIGIACIAGLAVGYATLNNKNLRVSKEDTKKKTKHHRQTSNTNDNNSNDNILREKSEYRGYYHTSDGRKTTYFNRELSEEEKALIGDTSPKRIDVSKQADNNNNNDNDTINSSSIGSSSSSSSSNINSGSAWNTAGTFEEKVVDKWAMGIITSLLKAVKVSENKIVVSTQAIEKLEGDAAMTVVRGKKRYIYDFSCRVKWKATMHDNKQYEGVITITEITGEKNYEMDIRSEFPCINESNTMKNVKKIVENGYEKALKVALDEFLNAFKSKY